MAVVITHVDDLHKAEDDKNVPADVTVQFGLDGADYEVDLTAEHAAEFRDYLHRYTEAIRRNGGTVPKKKGHAHHAAVVRDTPLKRARDFRRGQRAFADSRPDLGKASYTSPGGNFSYTPRLNDAYAEYVEQFGEFPVPADEQP